MDYGVCIRCGKPIPLYSMTSIGCCPGGCDSIDIHRIEDECSGRTNHRSNYNVNISVTVEDNINREDLMSAITKSLRSIGAIHYNVSIKR